MMEWQGVVAGLDVVQGVPRLLLQGGTFKRLHLAMLWVLMQPAKKTDSSCLPVAYWQRETLGEVILVECRLNPATVSG